MNPRTWRITTWWGKLIYVFAAWFVAVRVIDLLFGVLGVTGLGATVFFLVYDFAVLLVGARIFRGKGEPVAASRPWWQMTARKKLSNNLGSWLAVVTTLAVAALVISFFSPFGSSKSDLVLLVLYFGVPTYLYLNSAARLQSAPKPDADTPLRSLEA